MNRIKRREKERKGKRGRKNERNEIGREREKGTTAEQQAREKRRGKSNNCANKDTKKRETTK